MKQIIFFISLLFAVKIVCAQIDAIEIKKEDLSKELKYKGKFVTAVKWNDNNGKNILIISQTSIFMTPGTEDPDSQDKEIYGIQYVFENGIPKMMWTLLDFIRECSFDIYLEYLEVPPVITDLNNNGIAEAWLVYKLTCTSDVSPMTMKIIMHEGEEKYAIRGTNKVQLTDTEYVGGVNKSDKSFTEGPVEFLKFGEKLWEKNVINKW